MRTEDEIMAWIGTEQERLVAHGMSADEALARLFSSLSDEDQATLYGMTVEDVRANREHRRQLAARMDREKGGRGT